MSFVVVVNEPLTLSTDCAETLINGVGVVAVESIGGVVLEAHPAKIKDIRIIVNRIYHYSKILCKYLCEIMVKKIAFGDMNIMKIENIAIGIVVGVCGLVGIVFGGYVFS